MREFLLRRTGHRCRRLLGGARISLVLRPRYATPLRRGDDCPRLRGGERCRTSRGGPLSRAQRAALSRSLAASCRVRSVRARHARKQHGPPKPSGPIGRCASSFRSHPAADWTSSPGSSAKRCHAQSASRSSSRTAPGRAEQSASRRRSRARPDGYSVLVTNDNVASAPHILKTGTDYLNELVPVIQLARQPLALAVHPTLAVSSVAELIETAKRQPGLGCATSGAGSNQHVLLEWFGQLAGIKLDHVPYRGAGQAINDLIAGHVRVAFLGPTALIPHYKAEKLRLLAQSAETRSPNLPEVPTLQEAGFKGLVLETWYAAFVPLGTPTPAIARLNAEMDKALADPATGKSLLQTATEPVGSSAEQLARVARADSEKYARLARELNIKAN